MRKIFAISFIALVLLCQFVAAQQQINVAPGLNTLGNALNAANAGDVFVLQRNAGYAQQGIIDVDVPITIKAADGVGALPAIVIVANPDGSFAGRNFTLFADITLVNLAFSGVRPDGNRTDRIGSVFIMSADNLRAVFDGCTFVGYGGRTLEPGRDGATLIVRNCIETGNGRSNRVDNGRFIDFRAASGDTLILQNNTLLNCADRWIRHMFEDASLNYVLFDHNTFMNGTGYRPSFQFRNVKELYFTNNIVANPSILGTTRVGIRKDELEYRDTQDVCTFTIAGTDSVNTSIVMQNNNVWRDSRIDAILGGLDEANGDSVKIAPLFNPAFEARINVATAVFTEVLTFGHSPTIDSLLPELQIYASGAKGFSHSAFIFRTDEYAPGLDMSYGTSARAYTAAAGGFPLGDLNWYPDKKQEWIAAGMPITSVEEANPGTPNTFELSQNYPNPFNPETKISYKLAKTAKVSLDIYNALGQKVRTLVQASQPAGSYEVIWNGRNDLGAPVPTGVYFYRLQTGSQTMMKKMVLLK